jgi:hypothetical protein
MLRVLQQGMEGRAAQILRCIYTLHFVKCTIRKYDYTIHILYEKSIQGLPQAKPRFSRSCTRTSQNVVNEMMD